MPVISSGGGSGTTTTSGHKGPAIQQPKFDDRIYSLQYPLTGTARGTLKRGYMVWAKPISGITSRATVHFLYNPSTVEADYPLSDSTVAASLLFPTPGDKADLRVPLQQTVSWSILYDRTYELWESYNADGSPKFGLGADGNNPQVIGVLADIFQMQQFTGMTASYNSGGLPTPAGTKNLFLGHQGILQLVPSYVFFGGAQALSYYGYVSEWDVQITHWTQYMVPMRCVIDISFTMLPPVSNTAPMLQNDVNWGGPPSSTSANAATVSLSNTSGVSGR